jgi:riboflavin kinase/FMN adenylyltransferase
MLIETDYRAVVAAGQEGLPLAVCDAVVAIGNFDGVHPGHRTLLARGREIADGLGCKLVVLTFAPHPRAYFKPDQPSFLLTDKVQKQELLLAAGSDAIVMLRFDLLLAELSAEEFIDRVLVESLRVLHVIVGDNFVFGKGRSGNVQKLKEKGDISGFGVTGFTVVNDMEKPISSERIRQDLRQGRVATAEELLGRRWQLRGEIVRGLQQGREMGFPTANMPFGEYLQPALGIYAAEARFEDEEIIHKAVVYIGQRPTIGLYGPLIETHILDFSADVYGKTMRVDLVEFLRPDQKFIDLTELKQQIHKDVARTRAILV